MTRSHGLKTLGVAVATTMLVIACGPGTGGTARPGGSPSGTVRPASPGAQSPGAQSPGAQSPAARSPGGSPGGTGDYTLGYSNGGGVGNGFREEQVCTARAEALASGQVSRMSVIHRTTDAAGQLADLRTLIAEQPDAIVFNPNDPAALNPALDEAQNAGITTVAVDAFVTDNETYKLYNNQVEYAEIGARWLFEQLNGEGTVWYMRGFAGHPADDDRHTGFQNALADFPNIELVPGPEGVHTQWDPAETTRIANEFLGSGQYANVDGIWTSGMDSWVVDAIKAAGEDYKPIVGADLGAFTTQLLDETNYPGLVGAAVTNPASVGGAGVNLALKILNGEDIETNPDAAYPNTVLLEPELADNVTDEGKGVLQGWLDRGAGLNELWPLGIQIEGWTTYDVQQAIDCKGPGE